MTTQRIGKYACLEVEARYLVGRLPEGLAGTSSGWQITDRYIPHSRLRLRRMQPLSGGEEIYKLTQKFRSEAQSPYEATITNLYLTLAEYQLFAALEARTLQKKRYPYMLPSRSLSIDVFEGRHQGLILAEMELEHPSQTAEFDLLALGFMDVTADPFFTGGSLALMAEEAFKQGLFQRLRALENLR